MNFEGTTIVAVCRDGVCAMAGDGQVTMGENTVMKNSAKKVKKLFHDKVAVGFAGSVADAFTLSEKFEGKLEQCGGNLRRAAVDLAKEWRGDNILRKLEALLLATDGAEILVISGNGEVIDPDDGIAAIGSGGNYALAAARALSQNTELSPSEIAEKAIRIASSICIFTNDHITVEEIKSC